LRSGCPRLVEELGLKEGDELDVVAARKGTIEVETKEERRRRAIENLTSLNWTLPPDYKFDRDEANERWRPFSIPTSSSTPRHLIRESSRPPACLSGGGGYASVQVLNEFVHVARRKLRHDWPLIEFALQQVRMSLDDIVPITLDTHASALALARSHGFAFYDSLIVASLAGKGARPAGGESERHIVNHTLNCHRPRPGSAKATPGHKGT
jgi:antitoxin MazE